MYVFDLFFNVAGWGGPGKWGDCYLVTAVCLNGQKFSKNEKRQKEPTQTTIQRFPIDEMAEDSSYGSRCPKKHETQNKCKTK